MIRARKPTKAQEDLFLKCMEERIWLVLGTRRTAASCARARASWQEIVELLNQQRDGAFKTSKQWATYWKDKKTSLQKKIQDLEKNQLSAADPSNDLTDFEKGMLNILMRVERSAVGNTEPAPSPQAGVSPNRDGSLPPADNDTEEQRPDLTYPTCDMESSLQQRALARREWFREPFVTIEEERPNNTTMNGSRRKTPTTEQQMELLKCLEEKFWLGVNRNNKSLAARQRSRAAWEEVARKLNSYRGGVIRNRIEWAKYWKDKKAAVKRKSQQIENNHPSADQTYLTDIEQRILKIITREERSRFRNTKPEPSQQHGVSSNRVGTQIPADDHHQMLNMKMEVERSQVSNTKPEPSPQYAVSPNRGGSQPPADNAEDEEALSQLQNDEDQQDTEEQRPDLAYRTCDMESSLQQRALARREWFREPFVTVEEERPNNTTMNGSRRKTPTTEQQMELLKCLEKKFWLGVNRNNKPLAARLRTRAAWEEVARKLNSYRGGVIRNRIEWAKYWKDKKAAVKRKSQQIENNHPSADQTYLTDIEQRILKIITREERSRFRNTKPEPSQQHGVSSNRVGSQIPADDHHQMLNMKMEVERSQVSNTKPEPSPQYAVSPNRGGSQPPADNAEDEEALSQLQNIEDQQDTEEQRPDLAYRTCDMESSLQQRTLARREWFREPFVTVEEERPNNTTMNGLRRKTPTTEQQMELLKCLEKKFWLGVNRNNKPLAARLRTRAAWEEVARKLNSYRGGVIRNRIEWAKYWKDKKAAVKRKSQQIENNHPSADQTYLTDIEQRILKIITREERSRFRNTKPEPSQQHGVSSNRVGSQIPADYHHQMLNMKMEVERSQVSNTKPEPSPQYAVSPNRGGSQPPADNAEDEEALSQLQNDEDQQDTEEQRPDLTYPTCDMESSLQQRALARREWFREPLVTVEEERPNNTTMNGSRRKTPTTEQQMELLKCLEEKFWLGVNRNNKSLAARLRTRAAWEEVARKLNSYRGGVIKSRIEWAKYWKDKKAAVKRKSQQIENNHLSEDQTYLTDIEQRILEIITREERSRFRNTKPEPSQQHGVSSNRVGIQLPADDHHQMLNMKMEVERSQVSNTKPEPSPQYAVSPNRGGSQPPADNAEDGEVLSQLQNDEDQQDIEEQRPDLAYRTCDMELSLQQHVLSREEWFIVEPLVAVEGEHPNNSTRNASRSRIPTIEQQEELLKCLEKNIWLNLKIHSRYGAAFLRSRAAWEEIARKLNSCRGGAIKSRIAWVKFWKDKKRAVKRKLQQIENDHPNAKQTNFTDIEQRILKIITQEERPRVSNTKLVTSPQHGVSPDRVGSHLPAYDHQQKLNVLMDVECSQVSDTESAPSPQAGVSPNRVGSHLPANNADHDAAENSTDEARPTPRGSRDSQSSATPFRRRRRVVGRKRRSLTAALAERFLAIEERRVDNETQMTHVLRTMSDAWLQQTRAIQDLANTLRTHY